MYVTNVTSYGQDEVEHEFTRWGAIGNAGEGVLQPSCGPCGQHIVRFQLQFAGRCRASELRPDLLLEFAPGSCQRGRGAARPRPSCPVIFATSGPTR